MRILLFGADGQVGREVRARAHGDDELVAIGRGDADLMNAGAAREQIARVRPKAIINAAAYTNVDGAENDLAAADRINAGAVKEMALAAKDYGAAFVHISTDYVFDGASGAPLKETSPAGPLNAYGRSKLNGETLALAANPLSVILRTSWVYSAYGKNFLKTMLRLSSERETLTIVDDQVGGPTPASAIAEAALTIATAKSNGATRKEVMGGVYHFQGAPAVSWAGFAQAIFDAAGADVKITKIPTSAFETPAKRPLYTVLDCSRILRDFGIEQPDWRAGLPDLIGALQETSERIVT